MSRIDPTNDDNETATDVTSSENSKNSLHVLSASMALALVAAVSLFWYFGVFSWVYSPTTATG
jgi:hypothetical protein